MTLPLEVDWDKPNEKFLQFVAISNNWKISVEFWRNPSMREARLSLTIPYEMFDSCLMMYEIPNWKQCAIYGMSPLFQKGVEVGNERGIFNSIVSVDVWLGWFFCTCAVLEFPTHPQVLWNHFLSNLHHFPSISSKKH